MTWEPIETAPKDGNYILLWDEDFGLQVGFWARSLQRWSQSVEPCTCLRLLSYLDSPTHWMPLPQPPENTL